MRISDWSSDVCSSDLGRPGRYSGDRGYGAEARGVRPKDATGDHGGIWRRDAGSRHLEYQFSRRPRSETVDVANLWRSQCDADRYRLSGQLQRLRKSKRHAFRWVERHVGKEMARQVRLWGGAD